MTDPQTGVFELATDGPKVILVGIDDSVTSQRAGAYAAGLARRQGARLVCVYVEQLSALYGAAAGAAAGAIAEQERAFSETAADLKRQVEEAGAERGVPVTFVTAVGDPYHELRRVADEVRADAVVVGASTKAGHKLVGSLAVRLVKAGRWPVTVVPLRLEMGAAVGVAVVTGAGSGLGQGIALALLAGGWQVALAGRRAGALEATARAWGGPAESALAIPADVTSPPSVAALFDAVRDRWGRLDLLVNNAGVSGPAGQPDEIGLADWQAVVDTNLTGAFLCAQHAVRMMKAQVPRGGRIINNGSISAHAPRPGSICYTATKHAMTGLTKSLSLDGRAFDIACGQIDIGNAASEMTERMARGVPQADGSQAPEPVFDARHVADAVVYMASLPLDANVQFLTITATKMPYIGRG